MFLHKFSRNGTEKKGKCSRFYFLFQEQKKGIIIISILPNDLKSCNVGKLNFIDNMAFMASGFAKLIENVP
jgi:hypothetical protein